MIDVAEDGTLTWGERVPLRTSLGGELRTVRFLSDGGQQITTGEARYYKYDHLPGGFLLVPDGAPATATRLAIEGFDRPLTRTIAR
jgi:hypothetical protein